MYRKAWRSLLTLSPNLQGALSESLESKLEEALPAILDIDRRGRIEAVSSIQDLADTVAAQSGNQIPQAEANALTAALQQMIQLARYQPVQTAEESRAQMPEVTQASDEAQTNN
jgi:hypothetical protein